MTTEPCRMNLAPSSEIVARARIEVSAKWLPLCNHRDCDFNGSGLHRWRCLHNPNGVVSRIKCKASFAADHAKKAQTKDSSDHNR